MLGFNGNSEFGIAELGNGGNGAEDVSVGVADGIVGSGFVGVGAIEGVVEVFVEWFSACAECADQVWGQAWYTELAL